MPVSFRIFPNRGLVYVRYEGEANFENSSTVFEQYTRHPDCRPGQKQLLDLSRLTGIITSYPDLMKLQARKADLFITGHSETLIVYYAPTEIARRVANIMERTWDNVPGVVPLVVEQEEQALSLLGQTERSLGELMAKTG